MPLSLTSSLWAVPAQLYSLFPFTWWQHHFDATLWTTEFLTVYIISSGSCTKNYPFHDPYSFSSSNCNPSTEPYYLNPLCCSTVVIFCFLPQS